MFFHVLEIWYTFFTFCYKYKFIVNFMLLLSLCLCFPDQEISQPYKWYLVLWTLRVTNVNNVKVNAKSKVKNRKGTSRVLYELHYEFDVKWSTGFCNIFEIRKCVFNVSPTVCDGDCLPNPWLCLPCSRVLLTMLYW